MKKVVSIVLVLSIAAPFWISYSVIQYQKYTVKKEIKKNIIAGLNVNDLVLLKFSKKDANTKLEWEHSHEFEFSGVMYDVVESKTKNDSVYYWCWEDSDETELNIRLENLVEKAAAPGKRNNENLKRLTNFLSTLFHSYKNPFDFDRNKNSSPLLLCYLNFYSSLPTDPLIPPPKISSC